MSKSVLVLVALSLPILAALSMPPLAAQESTIQRLPDVSLPPSLLGVLRDYERAWQSGDEDGLAALFTPGGLVPSRHGWLRGRDAIRGKYEDSHGDLRLRAITFSASETVGFIVGAYGYGEDAAVQNQGNFVLALQRSSPESPWLIVADLDRGNERPD